MKKNNYTKKGEATIYIVIFTTMLFSIIALSFARIMLSENTQTINYSLSQSAYNSALAGIEDAKIALLKYQNCISTNDAVGYSECKTIRDALTAGSDTANDDCDAVNKALQRDTANLGKETMISSSSNRTFNNSNNVNKVSQDIDQAYTCVIIKVDTDDYISKLNSNYTSKFVPIRAENMDSIDSIEIRWYSQDDYTSRVSNNYNGLSRGNFTAARVTDPSTVANGMSYTDPSGRVQYGGFFDHYTQYIPPILRVDLIQTAKGFGLNQFYTTYDDGNNLETNRSSLTFVPSTNGTNSLANDRTSGFAAASMKNFNVPVNIKCSLTDFTQTGYACNARVHLPKPIYGSWKEKNVVDTIRTGSCNYGETEISKKQTGVDWRGRPVYQYVCRSVTTRNKSGNNRNQATSLLRLNLPYGGPDTTFEVIMYDASGNVVPFSGVQSIVDSTGRANDLFRRVEARLEMVDTYFPIPDAALTLSGDGNVLKKNYYVTRNCYTSSWSFNQTTGTVSSGLDSTSCKNYGEL